MTKYYCWECHKWLTDDEYEVCSVSHKEDISEYLDEYFAVKDKMTYKEWLRLKQ